MKKSVAIDMSTMVVQTENLLSSELDDETVLMSVTQATYYGLEATSQHIWKMIEGPRQVSEVVDQLVSEYDVERDRCEPEVTAFLTELLDEGLIRVVTKKG